MSRAWLSAQITLGNEFFVARRSRALFFSSGKSRALGCTSRLREA
jgi:hypothetical protein